MTARRGCIRKARVENSVDSEMSLPGRRAMFFTATGGLLATGHATSLAGNIRTSIKRKPRH